METKELIAYIAIIALVGIAVALVIDSFNSSPYHVVVSISAQPTQHLYPYNTTYFNITVKNEGPSISDMVLGFYVNGTALKYYKISIPHGDNVSISENYTFVSNGTYAFQAIADPGDLLNIQDRSSASSFAYVNVSPAESPDVYSSIPNNDIISTTSFTMSGYGMRDEAAISMVYNVTAFSSPFGMLSGVMPKIIDNLYGTIAYANGATANYANGSSAYVLWLKGTINPALIGSMLSTFSFPYSHAVENNTNLSYWKVNNSTSVCVFYQQGWTKVIAYSNATSSPATCESLAAKSYAPTESGTLVKYLKSESSVTKYQSKLIYSNSTNLGNILSLDNSSMSVANIFQNSYGVFAGVLSTNSVPSSNVCYGLLYENNGINICSVYTLPSNGKALPQYGMINSTEASNSITAYIYSLTNQSMLLAAHASAVKLLSSLNISNSISWQPAFKNGCAFYNSTLGCQVNGFNSSSGYANLSITNDLGSAIKLSSISCTMNGAAPQPLALNSSMGSNSSISISVHCNALPIPVIAPAESYILDLNYTIANHTKSSYGMLNVTNYGLP